MQTSDPYIPQSAQPDLSVYLAYTPEKLLPLFYGQIISMPLAVWQGLREQAALHETAEEADILPCRLWLRLLDQALNAEEELVLMENTPYLNAVGPFYYLPDKVCFHFPRYPACTTFGAEELALRNQALQNVAPIDTLLQKSLSQRSKATRKTGLSTEELQKEIHICMLALTDREKFAHQAEVLKNQALACSLALNEAAFIAPQPRLLSEMPGSEGNIEETAPKKKPLRKRFRDFFIEPSDAGASFRHHQRRQHLLALKMHENACDRYKAAREQWDVFQKDFCEKTEMLEQLYRTRQAAAEKNVRQCTDVLNRSPIHPTYQQLPVLKAFLCYLETGRASHLQSCINLYEEEQHWSELKDSQHRIENTILSWHLPELEQLPELDSETVAFLYSVRSHLMREVN